MSKSVPQHIQHKYSTEMGKKSEVIVLDVLIKNEASRTDMIDIMMCMQDYLGKDYPCERRVPSGGDQLTCKLWSCVHAARVHEPLRWVGRVPMGQKSFLTYHP